MTRKIITTLLLIFILSACGSNAETIMPTATPIPLLTATSIPLPAITTFPTSELSPYYGEPKPVQIIFDGMIYDSEIGTTLWISEVLPDGTTIGEIGDAFAIITPVEPIILTSNPSFTLKLSIPINPAELWYAVYKVSVQELNTQDKTHGVLRWNPDYKTQAYIEQTDIPLLSEQQLTFFLEPGFYVFEVNASWEGNRNPPHTELQADYGFLLEVQE